MNVIVSPPRKDGKVAIACRYDNGSVIRALLPNKEAATIQDFAAKYPNAAFYGAYNRSPIRSA